MMKLPLFSFLMLATPLMAECPLFEASLGVGVQNDRAFLTGFDDSMGTHQKSIQNAFSNIWTTFGRAEVGLCWRSIFTSYQADLGAGSSGTGRLNLALGTVVVVPVFRAPLSNSQIWNQKIALGIRLPLFKTLSIAPVIGWNQYESKWKIGTSTPDSAPYFSTLFDPTPSLGIFSLSEKGSHITERFSGAFIGANLDYAWGNFDASVGYRYSFGSYFNNYEHFIFDLNVPTEAELSGVVSIRSVQSSGEAQLANASLGYQLTSDWSLYVEGEGRWIQKTTGKINIVNTLTFMGGGMTQVVPQNQFADFKARWITYSITLGTRFTF